MNAGMTLLRLSTSDLTGVWEEHSCDVMRSLEPKINNSKKDLILLDR